MCVFLLLLLLPPSPPPFLLSPPTVLFYPYQQKPKFCRQSENVVKEVSACAFAWHAPIFISMLMHSHYQFDCYYFYLYNIRDSFRYIFIRWLIFDWLLFSTLHLLVRNFSSSPALSAYVSHFTDALFVISWWCVLLMVVVVVVFVSPL